LKAHPDDVMIVAAARALPPAAVCFVGIGLPSVAANLARRLQDPGPVLIYESGCIGARPGRLPLSIGDGVLADAATAVVSVPEIFGYWLQAGRVDVGFLGAAQLDRFANLNTTVVGDYDAPSTRLPGAGGAPEIAASCGQVLILLRHSRRAFVESLDFVTSVGFGVGGDHRARLGLRGAGPSAVITDLGVLRPEHTTHELELVAVHPGVDVDQVQAATGWDLRIAQDLTVTEPATDRELAALARLRAGTPEPDAAG
jgi:glutaconate CoA-transferase, subunit B